MARPRAFAMMALSLAGLSIPVATARGTMLVGYDGSNPFNCQVQAVGTGTSFPAPGDDPFCVDYDKTKQNVTQLGVVDFLLQEPARTAAISDKCFYYQRDHWYSSVEQANQQTAIYSWDGGYFYDKALGVGGAAVAHFAVNNSSGDPTGLPGFPEAYRPYFGNGRGGVRAVDSVPVDQRCVAYARTHDVYAHARGANANTPISLVRPAGPRLALRLLYRHGRTRRGRICARSAVRASLRGPDAGGVARVAYRVDGRTVAVASVPPFRGRIPLEQLGRRRTTRVVAQVQMDDGRSLRLSRRLGACLRRR